MRDPSEGPYDITKIYAVEASYELCPDRTVWVYDHQGMWHCTCCDFFLPFKMLIDPVPVEG